MTAAKREDASIWKKRVEGLEACGLSCRKYADQIGVNPNTLAGWRCQLRRQAVPTVIVPDNLKAAVVRAGPPTPI